MSASQNETGNTTIKVSQPARSLMMARWSMSRFFRRVPCTDDLSSFLGRSVSLLRHAALSAQHPTYIVVASKTVVAAKVTRL